MCCRNLKAFVLHGLEVNIQRCRSCNPVWVSLELSLHRDCTDVVTSYLNINPYIHVVARARRSVISQAPLIVCFLRPPAPHHHTRPHCLTSTGNTDFLDYSESEYKKIIFCELQVAISLDTYSLLVLEHTGNLREF